MRLIFGIFAAWLTYYILAFNVPAFQLMQKSSFPIRTQINILELAESHPNRNIREAYPLLKLRRDFLEQGINYAVLSCEAENRELCYQLRSRMSSWSGFAVSFPLDFILSESFDVSQKGCQPQAWGFISPFYVSLCQQGQGYLSIRARS